VRTFIRRHLCHVRELIGLSPPDRLDRRSLQEFRKNRQLSATTEKREEDQVCML
jgi:hypothetical protein